MDRWIDGWMLQKRKTEKPNVYVQTASQVLEQRPTVLRNHGRMVQLCTGRNSFYPPRPIRTRNFVQRVYAA